MKIKTWCTGGLISAFITVIGMLVLSFLMYRFRWGDSALAVPVVVIQGIAAFAGGWFVGKCAPSRRFLWGMGYGAAFFLILLIISLFAGGQVESDMGRMTMTAGVCLGGGMLGGMFG